MRISDWSSDVLLFRSVAIPEAQRAATTARLCAADTAEAFLRIERECLAAIANGDTLTTDADASRKGAAVLAANAARRRKLGHYLPAMWQYGGEWFWALDRLEFLHARLHADDALQRSEEHTSELQSLMRISYAVFCLKKKQ